MRSRSRSPRRRHSRSRSRDRRPSGKTISRPLRRSRSKSPQKSSKRKSDIRRSRSDSVKRRRSDAPLQQKDQKKREVQKQEADSTDSPQKVGPEKSLRKSDATKKDLKTKSKTSSHHQESAKDAKKAEKGDSHKPKQTANVTKQQQPIEETIESSASDRPFDQTEITLDDRFSAMASKAKPFVPDENVTIEIERIVAGRAVPFAIPPFWSDAVLITRRVDEGKKPLSDREEFLRRRDDSDDERRVVKVHRSVPENFDIRRDKVPDKKGHVRSREHDNSKEKSSRQKDSRNRAEERDRSRLGDKSDTRTFTDKLGIVVSTRTRGTDGSARPVQRSVMTAAAAAATTGRQFLLPAAATMAGDLRRTLQDRESARVGSTGNFMPGFRSGPVINQPNPAQAPQLPDFAHRPDKYAYEEWKERPELIPKGRSYYEHDDRDAAVDQWNSRIGGRGFGRGGMGGRGGRGGPRRTSFDRPPPRRGPPGRFQPREDSWKHDKFEEVEQTMTN